MRWRWVAGIGWAAAAVLLLIQAVNREFPAVSDYLFPALLLVLGVLMASGRGPASFAAFLATGFAAFMTGLLVLWNLGTCSFICPSPWLIAPFAVLTIVSLLAVREMTRRGKQPAP